MSLSVLGPAIDYPAFKGILTFSNEIHISFTPLDFLGLLAVTGTHNLFKETVAMANPIMAPSKPTYPSSQPQLNLFDMSYHNPLHTNVPANQRSTFTTLGEAVNGTPSSNGHSQNWTILVPQGNYTPEEERRCQIGHVDRSRITFDHIKNLGEGVPLRELSFRGSATEQMKGANDQVLAHTQLSRITLHIRWPGYVKRIRNIDILTPTGPITRRQLALAITQHFARFVERAQYEDTTSPEWRLGRPGITFNDIVLHSLYKVLDNAWQAEVSVFSR
uniref:Uncharacterized protein n=1 Tax=Moniliophthora roreri TaxID=221103 RepID=A0A0W0F037_MONRR